MEQKCPFFARLDAILHEQPNVSAIGTVETLQLEQGESSSRAPHSQPQQQPLQYEISSGSDDGGGEEEEEDNGGGLSWSESEGEQRPQPTQATRQNTTASRRPSQQLPGDQPAAKRRRTSAVDRTGAGAYMEEFIKTRREIQMEQLQSQERIQTERIRAEQQMRAEERVRAEERTRADERTQQRFIEAQDRMTQTLQQTMQQMAENQRQSIEQIAVNQNQFLQQLITLLQNQQR